MSAKENASEMGFSEACSFLLGTTAVHICGQEKQILCRTIPFACGLSLAFGLVAWLGK